MRTLPYGLLAAFYPVSPTSSGDRTKPFNYIIRIHNQMLWGNYQANIDPDRRIHLPRHQLYYVFAENPQNSSSQGTTFEAETQSGSKPELTSSEGERIGVEEKGEVATISMNLLFR